MSKPTNPKVPATSSKVSSASDPSASISSASASSSVPSSSPPSGEPEGESRSSRRNWLKGAGVAAAGIAAQVGTAQAQPQATRSANAGRRFKALVRYGTGLEVEELTLRPIGPREVLVQTEASMACYSITPFALGNRDYRQATIMNHSGMGRVVEVGPKVERAEVGDRVIVAGSPQCGVCYQCLRGRSDHCQFLRGADVHPIADRADGTPVQPMSALGGISELMVVAEEYTCPVFTDLPAEQLAMLADTSGTGLAACQNLTRVEPGDNVAVMGCGPLGLAAVQGARVMNADQIIAVDPIPYRRELAMKVGATMTLDPNDFTREGRRDGLVERMRELCAAKTDRFYAGGMLATSAGPDVVIEAVGGDQFVPKEVQGPDPNGILPIRQAWEMARLGGHIVLHGIGQRGEVAFPASAFCIGGKTTHAGQQGGLHMMRDLPRFVELIEKGKFDAESLVGRTYPLEQAREAFQAVADRTVVSAVVVFGS